eukprot:4164209-Prymnesium_polylepis.1
MAQEKLREAEGMVAKSREAFAALGELGMIDCSSWSVVTRGLRGPSRATETPDPCDPPSPEGTPTLKTHPP